MDGFGKRLKARAKELNLADTEVARRAGLGDSRYGNYVADAREPDLATLLRIADALEATPDHLLGVSKLPKKSDKTLKLERLQSAARNVTGVELDVLVTAAEALATGK